MTHLRDAATYRLKLFEQKFLSDIFEGSPLRGKYPRPSLEGVEEGEAGKSYQTLHAVIRIPEAAETVPVVQRISLLLTI